jgi:hypothetical protein
MEIKLNDVYKFWYNEEWSKKIFDPSWCFDGQLIVKQDREGNLYLRDTYWGSNSDSKSFTLEQALERGNLTFICNLNDVEPIKKYETDYYVDEDIFNLSTQHGCYMDFYKRKGAEKSPVKMEQVLKDKIQEIEHEIEWKKCDLKYTKEQLKRLQNGDLDIYI